MIVSSLFFYLFSAVMIAAAFMVISSRNPVHSVLFLILTFVNAAGLFIMTGAEFLGLLLIVVYVGAVAVLFLFVVMMLDVDFAELREGYLQYMPVGALVGLVVLAELLAVIGSWVVAPSAENAGEAPIPPVSETRNIEALGNILYTDYIFFFQLAGMVLLVAMIGAIVLTLRHKENVRRQNIATQVARDPKTAVQLRKVEPGQGL
ncbi:MAG: NADH-quinone oxidoreductase subunit J [Pseudomonadota bacterium]